MKKFILVIILLIIIQLFTYSQENQKQKYLLELSGENWNSWIQIQKETFVAGWMSSAYSLIIAIEENNDFNFTDEEKQQITNFLFLADNVLMVVEKLDRYYLILETQETYIWIAIYYVFDRWWGLIRENSTTEKIDEIVKQIIQIYNLEHI